MTLAIDSQEASGAAHRAQLATSLTWAFNNVAGNLLVVGAVVTQATGGATPSVSGITYNAVSMIAGPSISWDTGPNSLVQIFYLANPATGSHNVVVTGVNTGTSSGAILGGGISFSGAVAVPGSTTTGFSNSSTTHATAGAITTASGNYVLGVGGWGGGSGSAPTADHAATFELNGSVLTAGDNIESDYALSSGAAITPGFTWASGDLWGIVAVEIKSAAPVVQPFIPQRMPLGC